METNDKGIYCENGTKIQSAISKVLTFWKNGYHTIIYFYNYYLNDSEVAPVYKNKDLGIIFDAFLSFNENYINMQTKHLL